MPPPPKPADAWATIPTSVQPPSLEDILAAARPLAELPRPAHDCITLTLDAWEHLCALLTEQPPPESAFDTLTALPVHLAADRAHLRRLVAELEARGRRPLAPELEPPPRLPSATAAKSAA